ncbi:MAG TPA: radical SAM protein [Tepidisphaeraceae bacterium]|nr:radical SAM protein [Tepidisphaeraceae bacterium]
MPLSFNIDPILEGRQRLTDAQALELHRTASLHDLGEWARVVSDRLHPEDHRTYVIDRNINYTNVCTAKCTFCGFRRDHDNSDSYVLSFDTIGKKIEELISIGGTQILMQGGMNDRLPIEWYEDLLRFISTNYPTIHIHAFSPPEFVEFERFFQMDVRDILRRFKAVGLKTVPGGGGEIFAPRVRKRIGSTKCSGDDWLRIMRVCHEEGMNTSCTMMIGHIETVQERIDHMSSLRDMQDYAAWVGGQRSTVGSEAIDLERIQKLHAGVFEKSILPADHRPPTADHSTGRYEAFIHWPFQRENVPLGRAKEFDPEIHGDFDTLENEDVARGRVVRSAGAEEYLRTLAIARLFFDNIPSLQSSWVTMGPKIGQLALCFGANDMGGAMMEENVVSAAGTTYRLAVRELCRLIREAGWIPAQRDQYYNIIKRWDGPDSPDFQPDPDAHIRSVETLADKTWIGAAPGLDDVVVTDKTTLDPESARKLALTVLGDDR